MTIDAARAEIAALDQYGRLAARHLFSTLGALEGIAVEAAMRGAIPGHLDDELRHRDICLELASYAGGVCPVSPEIEALVAHLTAQTGEIGDALLAVVGESWVETLFRRLAEPGFCGALFAALGEDEARHREMAFTLPRPDPYALMPALTTTEKLLYRSAMSASYLAPIGYLRGAQTVWDTGFEAVAAHRRACLHLGVAHSAEMHRLALLCSSMRTRAGQAVEIAPPSLWRVSASRLWSGPAPISAFVTVPVRGGHLAIEAEIARRLAVALAEDERLRVVYRAGRWYRLPVARIGIRREHPEGGIMTVVMAGLERMTTRQAMVRIGRRARALGEQDYETVPEMHGLDAILPPATISAALSYCGHLGPIDRGLTCLVEAEGAPISVGVGAPRDGAVVVGVTMDHRVFDARDLGALCAALRLPAGSGDYQCRRVTE